MLERGIFAKKFVFQLRDSERQSADREQRVKAKPGDNQDRIWTELQGAQCIDLTKRNMGCEHVPHCRDDGWACGLTGDEPSALEAEQGGFRNKDAPD